MPAAVVVGSINKDIIAYVTRHPAPGETVLGTHSGQFPGGKGANQAVAIARLKRPEDRVRMIGRVGRDVFGPDLIAFLAGEGIDTTDIEMLPDAATGLGLITVDAKGENAIAVVPGANHLWPATLTDLPLAPEDIVVCQLEIPLAIVADAFASARRKRATTLLNPAPYQAVPADILRNTRVLVLNEIEAAQMLDRPLAAFAATDWIPAAQSLLTRGPEAVIVTLGAAGVLVVESGGRATRIPGRSVRAIDTTGAGDCFVGALVSAMMAGEAIAAAAAFANAAAAISVTREGAASSIPRRDEVRT